MYLSFFLYVFFILLLTFLLYFFSKKKNIFSDQNFLKPQSIHHKSIPNILGLTFVFTPILFLFERWDYNLYLVYLASIAISIIGFIDDNNYKISPKVRLLIQSIILSLFLYLNDFFLIKNFSFFNNYFNFEIFYFFITLCLLLALINAINFIDGQNGLVIIYIIGIVIFYTNISQSHFFIPIIYLLLHLLVLLLFNFPVSKCFLGDGGCYFLAVFLGLIFLSDNNLIIDHNHSKWLIANLLAYPVAETSISIIRRLINKKSPFYPDNLHIHSLIYKLIISKINNNYSNALTTTFTLFIVMTLLMMIKIFNFTGTNLLYYFVFQQIFFVFLYFVIFKLQKESKFK